MARWTIEVVVSLLQKRGVCFVEMITSSLHSICRVFNCTDIGYGTCDGRFNDSDKMLAR